MFALLSFIANNKNIDCSKFKKGTLYYRGEKDTTLFKVERGDSIQKETLLKTGDYISLKISWINSCEYDLSFISQHILLTDSISTQFQGMKLNTKIIRTEKDSCFIESYFVDDPNKTKIKGVIYIATGLSIGANGSRLNEGGHFTPRSKLLR